MKAYFIAGMGADCRIFKYIQLPAGYEAVYLDWIQPLKKESLREYALRLSGKIVPDEEFILVGLSMGGMIAVEIANTFKPVKTIIISSIPCSTQLPSYYNYGAKLKLHKLIPTRLIQRASILKRLFTSESKEDKILLKQIIRECDPRFIDWAMEAIVKWQNDKIPENLVHIHGTSDELLPLRFTQPDFTIDKGTHMMVLTRGSEVSGLLEKVLVGGLSASRG